MRVIYVLLILMMTTLVLFGQRQLDIQGNPMSTDTVATIRVNSGAATDVVGLAVHSKPQYNRGIGGVFHGGLMGILGLSESGSGFGIFGHNQSGKGVFGESSTGDGVYGQSTSGHGVFGETMSGTGVYGESESGNGVTGESLSSGQGVYGTSNSGSGIYGTSISGSGGSFFGGIYGVNGTSSSGTGGLFTGGQRGVHGNSPSGKGVFGESSTGHAIYGESSTGYAIYGISTSGNGVHGQSDFFGNGVTGQSILGHGVYGISEAQSGLYGQSADGEGVFASCYNGIGGYFYGGGGVAIELGGADSDWGQQEDDCVIRADAEDSGSDLIMVANDVISFHMDDDTNSTSRMLVYNDVNTEILALDEPGNLHVTGNITAGGTCCSSSDVHRKEKLIPVPAEMILAKVVALPISEWQYIGEDVRHFGPMAQDFHATFGLGGDDTVIASVDADGIALAAIQALKAENDALKERLLQLEARLARLEVE